MKLGCMFSGGKDSTYALHWAALQGFEIACLITVKPRPDSWLFHVPCIDLTKLQAEALGLPLVEVKGEMRGERELDDLRRALRAAVEEYGIDGIVCGALLSDYQRMRFAIATEELGLKLYAPLWRNDQKQYLREVTRALEFMVVSVSCLGLPKSLVGKVVTPELAEEIIRLSERYGFNPAFEGGEAETLVLDAPLFQKRLRVKGRVVEEGPYAARLVVEDAWLEDKR